MLKSYILIAVRHLARHRFFSVIMVCCLALGITFAMIIGLYVRNQEGVNGGIRDAGNQYMIRSKWKVKGLGMDITTIGPLAKTMKEEYPALVANYYRYNPVGQVVSAGENFFKENIAIGDTTLVSMYGFPLLYGDKDNAFPTISSAVITAKTAMKWFGQTIVVGKRFGMQTTAVTDRWLGSYAYRISQDLGPYFLACVLIFMIAFLLIAAQCWRTARANPVTSLRAD